MVSKCIAFLKFRYDVAMDINTVGPFRIMSFAHRFRRLKRFLQVSTGQNMMLTESSPVESET
jgi:hypothetical protein